MKAPKDIGDFEELIDYVTTNLDIDVDELQSIIGRVVIESSGAKEINANAETFLENIKILAYREAYQRHQARQEYSSKADKDELRSKKGGILKREYPDANPEKWIAKCQEIHCRFDYLELDSKVDEVICPVCNRPLWIEPVS